MWRVVLGERMVVMMALVVIAGTIITCGSVDAGDPIASPVSSDSNQKIVALDTDCSDIGSPNDSNISLSVDRGAEVNVRLRYQQGANAFWTWDVPESLRSAVVAEKLDKRDTGAASGGGTGVYDIVYDTRLLTKSSYQLHFECSAAGGAVYVAYVVNLAIRS